MFNRLRHQNNDALNTHVKIGNLPSEVGVHVDLDLTQESEILAGEGEGTRKVRRPHVEEELVAQGAKEISLACGMEVVDGF